MNATNVAASNGCSPNGLVGRDGVGVLLSCQSGVWRKSSGFDGNYVGLGSYTSRYDGRNNGFGTMLVYVSGGQSTVNKKVSGGDTCLNTWGLSASVNGYGVVSAGDNNSDFAKSGSISFAVPAGNNFTVISDPLPSAGCSPGNFNLVAYQ